MTQFYRPLIGVGGHFLSMQPALLMQPNGERWDLKDIWYRGDDFHALSLSMVAIKSENETLIAECHRLRSELEHVQKQLIAFKEKSKGERKGPVRATRKPARRR